MRSHTVTPLLVTHKTPRRNKAAVVSFMERILESEREIEKISTLQPCSKRFHIVMHGQQRILNKLVNCKADSIFENK